MENYDEIVGFDYTDQSEWKAWVREKFLPLYTQTSTIIKVREDLANALKENFKEAFNQESIKEILLGGVTKEGEYTPNSLAKFYKNALGISINPKEWIAYYKAGLDPAENGIECRFEDTSFLKFAMEIKELVEEVLSKIEVEPQEVKDEEIEKIINSPERLLEVIREFYKSIVIISANHDYHMFFVLNTYCIPRFFIEKAYPKLKDNFEKVAKILELEEKFVPNVSDERVREEEYTLIGHRENGLGDVLYELNNEIWKGLRAEGYTNSFVREIFELVVTAVVDLEDEYLEKCKKIVPENEFSKRGIWAFYFVKDDDFYLEMYSGNSRGFYNEGSTNVVELMNKLSPEVFLGVKRLERSEPNWKYEIDRVGYARCIYI